MKTSAQQDRERLLRNCGRKGPNECWLWQRKIDAAGYGQTTVREGGEIRHVSAHRASFALHYGQIPSGNVVRHMCNNRACINPAHLMAGTHQDNMDDLRSSGRAKEAARNKGRNWNQVSATDEAEISDLVSNGPLYNREIAEVYGITESTVRKVAKRSGVSSSKVVRNAKLHGQSSPVAKLSASDVWQIIDLIGWGMPLREVAKAYGVCSANVSAILSGTTWSQETGIQKHIKAPHTKITKADAQELRRLASMGVRNRGLQQRFGLGLTSVKNIKRGESWVSAPPQGQILLPLDSPPKSA